MFISDPVLYSFSLIDCGFMLFLLIYFIITLTDLECDYINSIECCSKLNFWTWPKLIFQLVIHFLLLVHGKWLLSLINTLITVWYIVQAINVPKGNFGIYDPTEIQNGQQYKKHMRECIIQIGVYLLLFFVYLFSLLVALVDSVVIAKDDNGFLSENPASLNQRLNT